jgi:hypothetical protein
VQLGGLAAPGKTALVTIAIAGGLVAWIAITHHKPTPTVAPVDPVPIVHLSTGTTRSHGQSANAGVIAPVFVTPAQLRAKSSALHEVIFWLGAAPKYHLELARSSKGAVAVRYLPYGVKAGDRRAFLTVVTYPFPQAYATAQAATQQPGTDWLRVAGGGLATYIQAKPTNVYVAFPRVDYMAEVYDPSPAVARDIVANGHVQRVH